MVNRTVKTMLTERLQQHPLLFATNHTDGMFSFGYSTVENISSTYCNLGKMFLAKTYF